MLRRRPNGMLPRAVFGAVPDSVASEAARAPCVADGYEAVSISTIRFSSRVPELWGGRQRPRFGIWLKPGITAALRGSEFLDSGPANTGFSPFFKPQQGVGSVLRAGWLLFSFGLEASVP